jgi:hypothetical protein
LPPGLGNEWVRALGIIWQQVERLTVGGSADDAGIGDLDAREVVAVNAAGWPGDLPAFYAEYYPGVALQLVDATTPSDMVAQLLPPYPAGKLAVNQRNPLWADLDLGECPGGETIGSDGCLLSTFDMMVREAYGTDMTPPVLNRLLADDGKPFTADDWLTNWADAVALFSAFDDALKLSGTVTAAYLLGLLDGGWLVGLGVSADSHFVYLRGVSGSTCTVLDPWTGAQATYGLSQVSGVRAAHLANAPEPPEPPQPVTTAAGLHDAGGGQWLASQGLQGVCCEPAYLGTQAQQLDYTALEAAGVRVLVRLNYGWATADGGQGTLPPVGDLEAFEAACLTTMLLSKGVWGYIYANEVNNPREYPANTVLTPSYYVASYNRLWRSRPQGVRLAPAAVDPTNAGWGDWRQSWATVLGQVEGADYLVWHAYCHGPELERITHGVQFENAPLIGVYYDLRMLESQQAIVPARFAELTQYVTECNHFAKVDGTLGWETGPAMADWVRGVFGYFSQRGVAGACLYRWAGDAWAIEGNSVVLSALASL